MRAILDHNKIVVDSARQEKRQTFVRPCPDGGFVMALPHRTPPVDHWCSTCLGYLPLSWVHGDTFELEYHVENGRDAVLMHVCFGARWERGEL